LPLSSSSRQVRFDWPLHLASDTCARARVLVPYSPPQTGQVPVPSRYARKGFLVPCLERWWHMRAFEVVNATCSPAAVQMSQTCVKLAASRTLDEVPGASDAVEWAAYMERRSFQAMGWFLMKSHHCSAWSLGSPSSTSLCFKAAYRVESSFRTSCTHGSLVLSVLPLTLASNEQSAADPSRRTERSNNNRLCRIKHCSVGTRKAWRTSRSFNLHSFPNRHDDSPHYTHVYMIELLVH
jgi:hypothetical protein